METPVEAQRDLLRFLVAGSVDDGKSTLVGRLLYDSNAIYLDQLDSTRGASAQAGLHDLDFSLITDGLKAEREQGITIDVAYRFFSTGRRKFILADVPGHEQYTRNMATGASTADVAVVLIDVTRGVAIQTQRHVLIAWLLGIRTFVVAVNKMDLVQFREDVFCRIKREFERFASKLDRIQMHFVPTCSLEGDNVAHLSPRTSWFRGRSLLEYLETLPVAVDDDQERFRLPVQCILRASGSPRRYAGQIASGVVRKGQQLLGMSSGNATRVTSIRVGDQEVEAALPFMSVSVALEHEIDCGRGDMLVAANCPPTTARRLTATVLWMSPQPLQLGKPYLIKHTARTVCATVTALHFVIDPFSLERQAAVSLGFNQFGEIGIETHHALYCDLYSQNRMTGAFIVIDPINNATLAAGMIVHTAGAQNGHIQQISSNRDGLAIWFTGLSSSGKSTISQLVYEKLWAQGFKVEWLDGDIVRQHLSRDLGFDKHSRDENVRRIAFVAELLVRNGLIVLVSAISPYRAVRQEIRERIGNFVEVYVHAPLEVCEQRDLKGIYRRARAGEIHNVTGIDDPYEPPTAPELECRTDRETCAESAAKVLRAFEVWRSKRTGSLDPSSS